MITYEIEGKFPVRYSTVTLYFGKVQKVADVKDNLYYTFGTKTVTPYQAGEQLVWNVTNDQGESLFEFHAPYKTDYLSIDIDMPRGMEDHFYWNATASDPIIRRDFAGEVKLKINFSSVVSGGDIVSYLKIAGRDCTHEAGSTDLLWSAEGYDDIKASYEDYLDALEIRVPNDTTVYTIQWLAAEPVPIEQMYHKPTHSPFYPKTAFAAVIDHNGNKLSMVIPDINQRITKLEPIANDAYDATVNHEGRITELEGQSGTGTAFAELKARVGVTETRIDDLDAWKTTTQEDLDRTVVDVASHEYRLDNLEASLDMSKYEQNKEVSALDSSSANTKTIYRLKVDAGAYKKGFYVYDGTTFVRIDNTTSGTVTDVVVNGESTVDAAGVASFDCAKAKLLTQDEYDALTAKDANTFYLIKQTSGTTTKIVKMYFGEYAFGSLGFILGAGILGTDALGG